MCADAETVTEREEGVVKLGGVAYMRWQTHQIAHGRLALRLYVFRGAHSVFGGVFLDRHLTKDNSLASEIC